MIDRISRLDLTQLTGRAAERQDPKAAENGLPRFYTEAKAPTFAQLLNYWFPGKVTPEMVTRFVQNMMQMIATSINQAKKQHEKVQETIKRRIRE